LSTAIAIGNSTLVLPIPGENYDLNVINANNTAIANEVNNINKAKHAEFNATATGNTAGASWDIGPLVVQSGLTVNNDFCTASATSGKLTITKVGTYDVAVVAKPTTNPGLNYVSIKDGADSFFYDLKESGAGIKWENSAKAVIYVPTVPFDIFFRTQWANTITCNSVVRVDKRGVGV
jgi:hypothetical protein